LCLPVILSSVIPSVSGREVSLKSFVSIKLSLWTNTIVDNHLPSATTVSPSGVGFLSAKILGIPLLFLIPVKSYSPSCIHNYTTSIHNILSQKWCTLYLSLFDPSNQRFHLQIFGWRNLNRGICHTPFFDLRYHRHTSSDLDRSLTFRRKFRQRGILKYLIFDSKSGPLLSLSFLLF